MMTAIAPFHPQIEAETEKQILAILARYENFTRIRPLWTA
jgi:hypothetical protein